MQTREINVHIRTMRSNAFFIVAVSATAAAIVAAAVMAAAVAVATDACYFVNAFANVCACVCVFV